LQQVVNLHAVTTIAAAYREEQPTVAEHHLAECFCLLHTIITYPVGGKLQCHKKKQKKAPANRQALFFILFTVS
jgi:hypothetical protein